MTQSLLLIEKEGGIATLILNRPESMNALNRELRETIVAAFHSLAEDENCRVVILTGAGRAFCAGMDLKEAAAGPSDKEAFSGEADVTGAMAGFSGPIIGAVNGHAVTAGFELALNCDILIASIEAKFADTHARVGMLPGWGLSQRLPRIIGINRAKELSLTGNYLGAEKALEWGLVNRIVQPDQLLETCRSLAKDILSCPPDVITEYKKLINRGYEMNLLEALAYESETAVAWAHRISPSNIAANWQHLQERGQQQGSG